MRIPLLMAIFLLSYLSAQAQEWEESYALIIDERSWPASFDSLFVTELRHKLIDYRQEVIAAAIYRRDSLAEKYPCYEFHFYEHCQSPLSHELMRRYPQDEGGQIFYYSYGCFEFTLRWEQRMKSSIPIPYSGQIICN